MARSDVKEIVVERDRPGQPHNGKVFAAVHAHLDDLPYYAGGLCAKLIAEGYTGYLIRTTNDEKCGGRSTAENILSNEQEHFRVASALGFKEVFNFYYQNHEMDGISTLDLRSRLILLFRMIKADTIVTFNPWGHGEENPDHAVTGRVVEEAAWMSAMPNDYPEHFEAGLEPCRIRERYYFYARPGQTYNLVVDTASYVEKKIGSIVECRSQGGGNYGSQLRAKLAAQGKRLPILGSDDRTADREYVRHFLLDEDRECAKAHDLQFAERFYYIDQRRPELSKVDEYVAKHAVAL
jgi:LmbE family N-acetylglucosaminyl deacetylase